MLKFEDISIMLEHGDYYFHYHEEWVDFRGKQQERYGFVSYWEMSKLIVSMGEIKIKNYIEKTFDVADKGKDVCTPSFKTKEEAGKCLEWLKQKIFETTLIGKENLEAEKIKKREEDRQKRKVTEKNKAIKNSIAVLEKFQQYIGKEVNFPMQIGDSAVCFKTTFLGISFDNYKLIYQVKTAAGLFNMHYKDIEINDKEIVSLTSGYYHESRISVNGGLHIVF